MPAHPSHATHHTAHPTTFFPPACYVPPNAMPGSTLDSSLADDLRTDFKHLDIGCRLFLGVSAKMFRAVRELSNIAVLVFAVYLMETTLLSTEVAVGVAILLYLGPAGIEQYLVRQGVIADRDSEGDNE